MIDLIVTTQRNFLGLYISTQRETTLFHLFWNHVNHICHAYQTPTMLSNDRASIRVRNIV